MPPLTDKHEVKKQQRAQLSVVKDLHENFNKHIKFIADRTYLQKMKGEHSVLN